MRDYLALFKRNILHQKLSGLLAVPFDSDDIQYTFQPYEKLSAMSTECLLHKYGQELGQPQSSYPIPWRLKKNVLHLQIRTRFMSFK